MKRKVDFTYRSRLQNAQPVAKAIVCCLGDFASALLWTHGLVWGDRTQAADAGQDWINYGQWRARLGATSGLFDLPGQLLDAEEQNALAEGIERTIHTGSDAIVLSRPARATIHLSHDDLISIHSRSTPSGGMRSLEELGLRKLNRGDL